MTSKYSQLPLSQRSSSEMSKETLLEKEGEIYVPYQPRKTWRPWILALALQAILLAAYTVIYLTLIQRATQQIADTYKEDSPAWPGVKPAQNIFDYNYSTMDTYFANPPTEAVDDKWDALLEYASFKFSEDDMTRWGFKDQGVLLTDNSGYMGTLNVFHELHCLKRVYMMIHKQYYFDPLNLTEYEESMNLRHIMHCMDGLRQSIMCHIDISPITYKWNDWAKLPAAEWTSPHQCRDWNTFIGWANENQFDAFQPGLVMHPKFGSPYDGPDDNSRKLGILLHPAHDHN